MFTNVIYTTLFVSDQDRALDFYTNVLGLEKRADHPSPAGRFLGVTIPGQDFLIVLWPGTPGSAKGAAGPVPGTLVVQCDDCRKAFDDLSARGVEFVMPEPLEQPWGRIAVLRDPDGHRIQIVERPKGWNPGR